ncbi:hypothetical protein MRX96_018174 [Rhipicephalus microplus]
MPHQALSPACPADPGVPYPTFVYGAGEAVWDSEEDIKGGAGDASSKVAKGGQSSVPDMLAGVERDADRVGPVSVSVVSAPEDADAETTEADARRVSSLTTEDAALLLALESDSPSRRQERGPLAVVRGRDLRRGAGDASSKVAKGGQSSAPDRLAGVVRDDDRVGPVSVSVVSAPEDADAELTEADAPRVSSLTPEDAALPLALESDSPS